MSFPTDYNSLRTRIHECSFQELNQELQNQDARVRILGELVLHEQEVKQDSSLLDKVICTIPMEAMQEEHVITLLNYFYNTPDAFDEMVLIGMLHQLTAIGNCTLISNLFSLIPPEHYSDLLKALLFTAATKGTPATVKFFLSAGVDINTQDALGNTLVHIAFKNQNRELLRILMEFGPSFDIKNSFGELPLHVACQKGALGFEATFLNSNYIEATDNEGNTPIIVAAKSGNDALFRALFNKGARLRTPNKRGLTAPHYLVFNKNQQLLLLLSVSNPFCRDLERRLKNTPFDQLEEAEKILFLPQQTPVDIHQFLSTLPEERKSALIEEPIKIRMGERSVSFQNCMDAIQRMKTQHFPLNEENKKMIRTIINSIDPTVIAIAAEDEDSCDILITLFPFMDLEHMKVFIPALTPSYFVNLTSSLLNQDDVTTAISLATTTQLESEEVESIDDKSTPLHHAALNDDHEELTSLLAISSDRLNDQDRAGCTPLHVACIENSTEAFDVLIEKNPDVNTADITGDTPLISACKNNNLHMVRKLIEKGADPKCANNEGLTPMHYVISNEDEGIFNFLKENSDFCKSVALRIKETPYKNLTVSEKKEFFHLQAPETIQSIAHQLPNEIKKQLFDEPISVYEHNIEADYPTFHSAFKVIKEDYLPIVDWRNSDSTEMLGLKTLLNAIPVFVLASAMVTPEYKDTLLRCIPLMNDRQIKVAIPLLSEDDFFQVINKIQAEKTKILKAASLGQIRYWLKEGGLVSEYLNNAKAHLLKLDTLQTDDEKREWLDNYHALILPSKLETERSKIDQLRKFLDESRFTRMRKNINGAHEKVLKLCDEIQALNEENSSKIEALKEQFKDEIPEELIDPISQEMMNDPIELLNGTVVDRATLYMLNPNQMKNPFNRQELTEDQLKPRPDILAKINEWKTNHPD